ncbi:MAG: FAD-dependent oxidoreductase [Dehalococcoidia bacterium]|nr:FAD-dependent oxidoreductase [Dehalococcoidia bacterium]
MKDFEVIVIGAGLGGISAAASLAKAGKKVLLLEKHNVPGGYATSFVRGRYEFEVALHGLSGLGDRDNQGPILKMLNASGVAPKVEFLRIPEVFKGYYPDFELTLPVGRENHEEALCRQFPGEKEGIKKYIATIFEFADQALKANRIGMKAVMQDPGPFSTLMTYYGKSLAQVIDPLIKDEKLRAVLGQTWGYYALPPSKLSFLVYTLGMASYIRFGMAHIRGTSQALSQAFIDAIEENGGRVWLNNGAKRILTSRGRVSGVLTDDGTELSTRYIVCNANPLAAALQLLGRDRVPGWYLNRLGAWSRGASTFNVYLGVDCDSRKLGLEAHENFVNVSYDLEKQYAGMKSSVDFQPDGIALTAYSLGDPTVAPAGASSIVLTSIAYADPWLKLKQEEYQAAKNRLAARMIRTAERAAPGLGKHIEEVEVATPLTNIRYTGNPGGSIVGFDENYQGTGSDHLPQRGPVEGLYFAGAWVNLGGGFEPCIASGAIAARQVVKDMEKGGWEAEDIEKVRTTVEKQAPGVHELRSPLAVQGRKVGAVHPRRLSLKVQRIIEETASARTLRMVSGDGKLPVFRAGQYINLFVKIGKVPTSRPYSISSAPGKPYYDLTVRRVERGFVSEYLLKNVSAGDEFESTAPSGSFYHEPLMDSGDLVFLAGGSGITPFMSIIRQTASKKLPLKIHLLYGSRRPDDIIFKKELDRIAGRNPDIRIDYVISEPPSGWKGLKGFLDKKAISGLVGSLKEKTLYICGPAPMYALCESALIELGVPLRRIHREVYGPPACVADEQGWPKGADLDAEHTVIEERSGRRIKARTGEPLMAALERAGVVIPAVCRSGECTACRTRLVSGKVFTPQRARRRLSDVKSGYIHPCMTYALGDLRIRI